MSPVTTHGKPCVLCIAELVRPPYPAAERGLCTAHALRERAFGRDRECDATRALEEIERLRFFNVSDWQ